MFDHITEVVWSGWTGELFMNNGGLPGHEIPVLDDWDQHYDELWTLIQGWEQDDSHYTDESYVIYRRPE